MANPLDDEIQNEIKQHKILTPRKRDEDDAHVWLYQGDHQVRLIWLSRMS